MLLAHEHPQSKLVQAFNHCLEQQSHELTELPRRFQAELAKHRRSALQLSTPKLAAIRVERRSLAAAVFTGTHLEAVRFRHLSSKPEKAESSAAGFVRSLIREFSLESVALETIPATLEIQRKVLTHAVRAQLVAERISIWEVTKKTVIAAFAHPPLRTRTQLRDIIRRIWPELSPRSGRVATLDAAALGLFIQTERLFNHLDANL